MVTVIYRNDGMAISDFECEKWVEVFKDTIKANPDYTVVVASSIVITAIRLAVLRDEIDFNGIQFKYNDEILKPNTYGRLANWPNGFCDYEINLIECLLKESPEKYPGE